MTCVTSESFGALVDRPPSVELEIRASWTPVLTPGREDVELAAHLGAWGDLLCTLAGLPPLPEDEFYHADLIGLTVVDTGGAPLGTVRAVLDHGAGDILEIARPGAADLLLPFTRTAVPTVDIASRRIVADPPQGLIES